MMEGCPVLRRVLLKLRGVDAGAAMEPANPCTASFDGEVLVLAKLKGFPWWPAVDKGTAADGRRIVSFFAWHGQYSLLEDSCVRAFECHVSPPPCLYLKKKRKLLDLYLMAVEEAQEWPRQKAEELERARKQGSSAATNKSVPIRSSLRPSKAPAEEEGTPPRQERRRLKSGGRRGTKRHSPPNTSRTAPGSVTSIASSSTDEPLRNSNPEAITEMGFVEIPGLLSEHLCHELASLPMTGAEGISNAFQKDLPEHLREQVIAELSASCILRDAVRQTFGTERYAVQTTKVLMTEFGAEPQIPHADDYCNRILFGVAHLLPQQPSTEAMPYRSEALYPTGLLVQCDECGEWRPLPDKVARYRAHTQHFNCSDGNFHCVERRAMESAPLSLPAEYHDFTAPNSPTLLCERDGEADVSEQQPLSASTGGIDIQEVAGERNVGEGKEREGAQEKFAKGEGESWKAEQQVEGGIEEMGGEQEDDFARGVCEAFSDLLWRPDELMESMRPLGVPNAAGDAVVALPTLIHRGPGGNDEHAKDRLVLFFTVQPLYSTDDELVGTYDPEAQIHAGWIMWRAWELLGEKKRDLVIDNYRKLGYDLQSFGQGGKIFWEDEEMQSRRKKRKADGKHSGEKASHRQIKFDEELHG